MPVERFEAYTAAPVETRPIEVRQVTRPAEVRTTTKVEVEDNRSIGEKAKDALHHAAEKTKEVAHDIKEKLTPEVKDKDIAKAERKYNELKVKEDNDRFRAESAEERRQELLGDAKMMQAQEFANREKADMHREERQEQAEKVADLQCKQNHQHQEKCNRAMLRGGAFPEDVKVTRVTEIH